MSEEFRAYWFSFRATGVEQIDEILRLVARAGKAFHGTELWADEQDFLDGRSYIDMIQEAADLAAGALGPDDSGFDEPVE